MLETFSKKKKKTRASPPQINEVGQEPKYPRLQIQSKGQLSTIINNYV